MWNNSKSAIRYTWGKISDCHIIEVEPCTGTIGTSGTAGEGWWGSDSLWSQEPGQE